MLAVDTGGERGLEAPESPEILPDLLAGPLLALLSPLDRAEGGCAVILRLPVSLEAVEVPEDIVLVIGILLAASISRG